RALAELPQMELALEKGELVYSVVRELTRVVVPETAPDWMAAAQGKTLREVEDMVSGRAPGDPPEAPPKPELILHLLRHEVTGETYANFRELAKICKTKFIMLPIEACPSSYGVEAESPPTVPLAACVTAHAATRSSITSSKAGERASAAAPPSTCCRARLRRPLPPRTA